ncbi:MAG: 28S ribosomal protein S10, mitochondrial [Chaenotheca gracillima]|nr:MAG: 28S ribosomal protein S10, mitochondrial [Chaenotheca gracillima]
MPPLPSRDVITRLGKSLCTAEFRNRPELSLRRSSTSSDVVSSGAKNTIFSGIQPTGIPHIGNYLGALKPWVKLQNEAIPETKLVFSIVDAHAITVPQDARELWQHKRECLASLLAIGLDHKRSIIYYQSDVSAGMGYLQRMTQWKSKMSLPQDTTISDNSELAGTRLGLFAYPVLQAADILLHRATHVPVGEDQEQHLEFARRSARVFNSSKGKLFPEPETIVSPARRVMSLRNPLKKMSKSDPFFQSRILITDDFNTIRSKVYKSLTDSIEGITYEPDLRRGVANLLEIMSGFDKKKRSPEELAKVYEMEDLSTFKADLIKTLNEEFEEFRNKYHELMDKDGGRYLDSIAAEGARKARASAEHTMGKDLRNHGDSPHDPRHDYTAMAEDVETFIHDHGLKESTLIGHSMGAKTAMTVALRSPSLISSFISVDNAPIDAALKSDFAKYVQGMRKIENAHVTKQIEADEIMKEFEEALPIRQFLLTNLVRTSPEPSSGSSRTHLVFRIPIKILAAALDNMADFPFKDPDVARFEKPALFIRGTKSHYVSDECLPIIGRFFPRFEVRDLATGHWVISEDPEGFRRVAVEFLKDQDAS